MSHRRGARRLGGAMGMEPKTWAGYLKNWSEAGISRRALQTGIFAEFHAKLIVAIA